MIKSNDDATSLFSYCQWDGTWYLRYDINNSGLWFYTITLAKLSTNEMYLNDGRFTHYTTKPQPLKIQVNVPREVSIYGADHMMWWFSNVLEWIAENVTEAWSFKAMMDNVNSGVFEIGFSNATQAMAFALVWVTSC